MLPSPVQLGRLHNSALALSVARQELQGGLRSAVDIAAAAAIAVPVCPEGQLWLPSEKMELLTSTDG